MAIFLRLMRGQTKDFFGNNSPPRIHPFIVTLLFSPTHFHPPVLTHPFSPTFFHPKSGWRNSSTVSTGKIKMYFHPTWVKMAFSHTLWVKMQILPTKWVKTQREFLLMECRCAVSTSDEHKHVSKSDVGTAQRHSVYKYQTHAQT